MDGRPVLVPLPVFVLVSGLVQHVDPSAQQLKSVGWCGVGVSCLCSVRPCYAGDIPVFNLSLSFPSEPHSSSPRKGCIKNHCILGLLDLPLDGYLQSSALHRTKWPWALTLQRDRDEPCPPKGPGRGDAGWTSRRWCCSYMIQIVTEARDFVLSNRNEIKHFFKVSWILSACNGDFSSCIWKVLEKNCESPREEHSGLKKWEQVL